MRDRTSHAARLFTPSTLEEREGAHGVGRVKVSLVFLLAFIALPALASTDDTAKHFRIDQQVLLSALNEFARQSDRQILFSTDVVDSKRTAGVRGDLPPEAALRILLKGTGLTFRTTADNTILVEHLRAGETADTSKRYGRGGASDPIRIAQAEGQSSHSSAVEGAKKADSSVTTGETSSTTIEEITVTARKRSENLQTTPISISAFTARGLEARQIDNIAQVATYTPNLIFGTSSSISGSKASATMFIRGVGQTDFVLSTDPGVGLYLDGVYISRSIGAVLEVIDIERVEVLRGPQGTLFGRNTIGGAISLTSKNPTKEFGGSASVTTGSFDRWQFKGNVNIPLAENLLSSFSVERFGRKGYIERPNLGYPTGGDDSWSGRGVLLWTPASNLSFKLAADGTVVRANSCCNELVAVNENGVFAKFNNGVIGGGPLLAPTDPGYFGPNKLPTRPYQDNTDLNIPDNLKLWGTSLTGNLDLQSGLSLKSITAYRSLDAVNGRDLTHSADIQFGKTIDVYKHEQFSQELQLQDRAFEDKLKWIAGLYFFDEKGKNIDDVNFNPVVHLISGGQVHNSSFAVFSQATYDFTNKLSLTAGVRWTEDIKRFAPKGHQYVLTSGIGIPPGTLLVPDDARKVTAKESLPMVNLAYRWTPDIMTYATYSKGYKGGGFTQRVFPPLPELPSFAPEFVSVYELGFKVSGFQNKLQVNGDVFRTDYTNLQVLVQDVIAPVTRNAAKARINGAELELKAIPIENMTLEIGVGYLDAKYLSIDPSALLTGLALNKMLVNAPRWSLTVGPSYLYKMGAWGTITPRIDWSYKSTVANDAFNQPSLVQKPYGVLGAGVTFDSSDGKWAVTATGKNLTNRRYIVAGFGDLITQSAAEASFGRPREWALTVKRSF